MLNSIKFELEYVSFIHQSLAVHFASTLINIEITTDERWCLRDRNGWTVLWIWFTLIGSGYSTHLSILLLLFLRHFQIIYFFSIPFPPPHISPLFSCHSPSSHSFSSSFFYHTFYSSCTFFLPSINRGAAFKGGWDKVDMRRDKKVEKRKNMRKRKERWRCTNERSAGRRRKERGGGMEGREERTSKGMEDRVKGSEIG